MPTIERAAQVSWTGDLASGSGTLTAQSGAFEDVALTFPRRVGEPAGQTSPEELIASAHAGCFAMSLAAALGKATGTAASLSVRSVVSLDRHDGKYQLTASALTVRATVAGLDEDGFAVIIADADARCPVSSTLRATARVTIDAELNAS